LHFNAKTCHKPKFLWVVFIKKQGNRAQAFLLCQLPLKQKEIADNLHISIKSVENALARIRTKINI
jgi:DNA-binding transcriptional regulator LsrR (DeoR family)